MYALLLFILFPIIYNTNRTWYFLYALLFYLIGRFIAYKMGLPYATIIHNVFYIGILIPFVIDKAYRKFYSLIAVWIAIYIIYLLFLFLIHGNDFLRDIKDNFRIMFLLIFAVEVYENIRRNKIDLELFVKVFTWTLIFEIVLCWMQFFFHDFGNLFRVTEYSWGGEVRTISGNTEELLSSNLCLGTLMGSSVFANYLTFSIVSLILAKHKAGLQARDYFLLAITVPTLLITGIRAPFIVLLIMLYFILLKGKRVYLKVLYAIISLLVVVVLLPILSDIGSQGGLNSVENPILRSLNFFTQLESGTISEEGTLTWPLSMIPYILRHPIFGNGLHYGRGYYMHLNFHVLEAESTSDAGFFFYWAEYGLVGLLIFFYFYFYLVKICSHYGLEKKDIRFLVIMIFLLSIVDCSIINHYCTTVFALSPIIIMYYQRANSNKNYEKINS